MMQHAANGPNDRHRVSWSRSNGNEVHVRRVRTNITLVCALVLHLALTRVQRQPDVALEANDHEALVAR